MNIKRRPLFWFLLFITVVGDCLILNAAIQLAMHGDASNWFTLAELAFIGIVVTPWSMRMPSGASWRPGIPLMMMSIFLMPPTTVVVVNVLGLVLITARARAVWWKYFETLAHAAIGLYLSAWTYVYLNRLFHFTLGHVYAVVIALCVHLIVNRFISSAIVAHREHRTLTKQLRLVLKELHWGYFNAYLLIVMVSLFDPKYLSIGIFMAALIQAGIFVAASNYSNLKTLQNAARTDGLTSLENRSAWESLINDQRNIHMAFKLCVIDINNFKDINDKYGHLIGDKVLRKVADSLKASVPGKARIFRIGGDEFVVYIHDRKTYQQDYSKRIKDETAKQFVHFSDLEESVYISVGEATAPQDGEQMIELFQLADKRMYVDKGNARFAGSAL